MDSDWRWQFLFKLGIFQPAVKRCHPTSWGFQYGLPTAPIVGGNSVKNPPDKSWRWNQSMLNRKWNLKIKHVEKYMALVIWCLRREIEDIHELLTIPKIKRVNYLSRLYRDATTQGHDMFSLTARTFTSHWHHGRESIPTHILVYLFNLGSSWFSPTSGVLFFSRSLRSWNASFTQKHRPCKDRARFLSFANKTLTVDVYSKNYTVTYMSIHTSKSILNQRKIYNQKQNNQNGSTWHVGYLQGLPPLELPWCGPSPTKWVPARKSSTQVCARMGWVMLVSFHEGFHLRRIFVGYRLGRWLNKHRKTR